MTNGGKTPIFYDPKGRRWTIFRIITGSSGVLAAVIASCFFLSILETPSLPELRISHETKLRPAAILAGPLSTGAVLDLKQRRTSQSGNAQSVDRYAFFNHWDENSFASLREHAGDIDVLVPEWLHLAGAAGEITHDDSRRENHVRLWLKKSAPNLKVLPLINNYDPTRRLWDGASVGALLASAEAKATLTRNLLGYAQEGGFAGITIDFKSLPDEATGPYLHFIKELKSAFSAEGLEVYVVLPAYETRFETAELAAVTDRIILLAYDEHWEGGVAGPLAAQAWFEKQLEERFKLVAGSKIVVAIGSYAVDWQEGGRAKRLPVSAAWDLAADAGIEVRFHSTALNPTFAYHDETGARHVVWMLDGTTMFNQIDAAFVMSPAGIALARLGTEDPSVWQVFARGKKPDANTAKLLENVEPSRSVVYKGEGEVLKATDRVSAGRRIISYDDRYNLITDQRMAELPRSLTITRLGHTDEKLIALTFDDGPSREFTPQILRILREKDVKATFFVVGANAALEPGILRAIYADGHDIGNHTFTHPNLSEIPAAQLDLELNATQRVLESKLGVRTTLFRPPFVKDIEPETRDQARTLVSSAAMGYITIGLKIDPLDWERPGALEIVNRTINYAMAQRGNIVLLHDAGGDRSQTVEALPMIIDELRARGFRFVTVSELLGLSRAEVMPPLPQEGRMMSWVNDLGFSLARHFTNALGVVFILGLVLGLSRLCLVAVAACVQTRHEKRREGRSWRPQSVAVIVPAYNEENVICDCVSSLLQSRYPDFDIIVVDDGSTDGTAKAVREAFRDNPRVKLCRKPNGGKASALNWGIARTQAEIIVAIDADTRLDPNAISELVRHFEDPKVGAVAGAVYVGNANRLLTQFQAIEYISSQNLDRRALEIVNGITVVPGAIGAWRREAVLAVDGYDTDTLAEDADLTLKIERVGWRVIHESRAFALTEAPDGIGPFLKQRFRWMYGTLQVAFKNLMMFRRQPAGLKYVTLPNVLIFQFLFALIAPVVDLVLVLSIAADLWDYYTRFTLELSDRTWSVLTYWLILQTVEVLVGVLAFSLDRRGAPWLLLPLIVLQRFCYRQLLYWVALKAAAAAIRGGIMGWGKLQRRGLKHLDANRSPPQLPIQLRLPAPSPVRVERS